MDHAEESDRSTSSDSRSSNGIYDLPAASVYAGDYGPNDSGSERGARARSVASIPDERRGSIDAYACLRQDRLYFIQMMPWLTVRAMYWSGYEEGDSPQPVTAKERREAWLAWRACYLVYNTAMVLHHGFSDPASEYQMLRWLQNLDREVDPPLERYLRRDLDDEVQEFAGNASMSANDLRYRLSVVDPTVGLWEMRISNLRVPGRRRTRSHRGPNHPDLYNDAEQANRNYDPTLAGPNTCPWESLGEEPCGERCRAIRR